MDSSPTLQDFVLNLIYDPVARSAFELDPHGTLQEAGLGDVTAADVQDVLPLVLDYAPLSGLHSVDGLAQVDDLTTGVANLDVAGAAAHLQTITAQLGGTGSPVSGDLNIAAAGAVTVTADHLVSGVFHGDGLLNGGVAAGGGLLGHVGVDLGLHVGAPEAGLTAEHDPAAGLDAGVTAPVQTAADTSYAVDGLLTGTTPGLTGTLDATVNAVTGLTGSIGVNGPLDLDVSGVHEATSSVIGSVSSVTGGLLPDGTVDGTVGGTLDSVDHTVSGVTGTVSGVVGGLTGGTDTTDPDAGHDVLGGLTGLHF